MHADALNADEAGNSRGAAQAVASQPAAAPPQPALAAPPEAAATAGGSKQGKGTKHRPSMSGTQSAGQPQPQQPVALQGVASSGAPARELPEADIAALLAPVAPGSVLDVRAFTMLQARMQWNYGQDQGVKELGQLLVDGPSALLILARIHVLCSAGAVHAAAEAVPGGQGTEDH